MVDKQQGPAKPEQDPFVEEHRLARQILRKHYDDEIKRASAMHLEVAYAQSQIDYDREHRPQNTTDIPGFEKRKAKAAEALSVHETKAMELRDSLKLLGETFLDEEAKRGNGKEQQ